MRNKNVFLWDLDGTLTDPGEGITNSVAYAMRKMGIPVPPRRELYAFIGPPLVESFENFCSLSHEEAERALALYREYYAPRGIFENRIYDGIPALLSALSARGRVVLATSKPEPFAETILEHFGLAPCFSVVAGSTMDERRVKKGDIIADALSRGGIDPSCAVMIGDRAQDIRGAKENGIFSIGVLYGYGTLEELRDAGADVILPTVAALDEFLREDGSC